jgi:hypothetical protein
MNKNLTIQVTNSVEYPGDVRYNLTVDPFTTLINLYIKRRKVLAVTIGVFTSNMSVPFANFSVMAKGRLLTMLQAN